MMFPAKLLVCENEQNEIEARKKRKVLFNFWLRLGSIKDSTKAKHVKLVNYFIITIPKKSEL